MMIRTVIVEDEPYAREHLESLVNGYCKNVEIVGHAGNVASGFELIEKAKPDLVLLDIEMPDGTGFELLQKFPKVNFEVIFTTAFAEYALQAFNFSAIHYLLKPIDPEELALAINKAEDVLHRKNIEHRINALYYNLKAQTSDKSKIVLSSGSNLFVVYSGDIIMCRAEKNYTRVFLADGRDILVSKTIKEYDGMLSGKGFFRVHRQYLINADHVKSLDKSNSGTICLTNNFKVPVSLRKKDLMEILTGVK
jgi:two-component system LytT family response regulator